MNLDCGPNERVVPTDNPGPGAVSDEGAIFMTTDGQPVYVSRDAVLSAKPNECAVGEDGNARVVIAWLRGHRRPTALETTWKAFVDAVL